MKDNIHDILKTGFCPSYITSLGTVMDKLGIVSPIEKILYFTLTHFDYLSSLREENYKRIKIFPQKKIGKYRVDFKVKGDRSELIVECDSQMWHEKDEKQRRYEKERDRYLQSKEYKVFHYTGKELMSQPLLPAVEIINQVTSSCQSERIERIKKFYKDLYE